jgi:hypothetical protein
MGTVGAETPVQIPPEREYIEQAEVMAAENEEMEVEWPTSGDTPSDEYRLAEVPGKVGRFLIEHLPQFEHLGRADIAFVYRNKKDWRKDGKIKAGECKVQSGINRFFAECDFAITINFRFWEKLNPHQRVALLYHELRHAELDEDGKASIHPHDFEVFGDELELFGLRTYEDWVRLGRSIEHSSDVHTQYDLPLLAVSDGGAAEGGADTEGDAE